MVQENLNFANIAMGGKEDNDLLRSVKQSASSKDLFPEAASKAYKHSSIVDNGANYLHPCAITAFAALKPKNTPISSTMVNIPPPKKPTKDPSKRTSTAAKRTSTAPSQTAPTDSVSGPTNPGSGLTDPSHASTDPPSRASTTAPPRTTARTVATGRTNATSRITAGTRPTSVTPRPSGTTAPGPTSTATATSRPTSTSTSTTKSRPTSTTTSRPTSTIASRPVSTTASSRTATALSKTATISASKTATGASKTTTGASKTATNPSRTTSLAQPKTATTTQGKATTVTAPSKSATTRTAPAKPVTTNAAPSKPATTLGPTKRPILLKKEDAPKTETPVKTEAAVEKEDPEKKETLEKKNTTEKKDAPENKATAKKQDTTGKLDENGYPEKTCYVPKPEEPKQRLARLEREAEIEQLRILAAIPREKFYLVLDLLYHQDPPQPWTLVDQLKRGIHIDGLGWEPVFVPRIRTAYEILIGVKEEKSLWRDDSVSLDLCWRGRYRKFSSKRAQEFGGGENWVTIDENKEGFYETFLRLKMQGKESEEEKVVRLEIEELERKEEMEEYVRAREERARKIKEAGETGGIVDFGFEKVIYPDGDKNELPDLPIRKLQIEIYLETAKKDQIIAALPNAIKHVEEKMDKRIPTAFLYTTKARSNDPEKLLFKSERPIEGLDKPTAGEILETEARLALRKKPWHGTSHASFTGCHNHKRPTDKIWNDFIKTAGFRNKELKEGWKGNTYYGPNHSKPIKPHPRGLGEVILGIVKNESGLPQAYESHVHFGNLDKTFPMGEGWDELLARGKGKMWPLCEGVKVSVGLVTKSLLAMRREGKGEGQRGMRWNTKEERCQWVRFLESREEEDKKRRLKVKDEKEKRLDDKEKATRVEAGVLKKLGGERRPQGNDGGAEKVTRGDGKVEDVADENGEAMKVSEEKGEKEKAEESKKAEFLRLKEAMDGLDAGGQSDHDDAENKEE